MGLEPPSLRELRQRAGDLFQRMDADASGALSLSELVQWTASQDELVLLLSRVCGAPFLGSYTKVWLAVAPTRTRSTPTPVSTHSASAAAGVRGAARAVAVCVPGADDRAAGGRRARQE